MKQMPRIEKAMTPMPHTIGKDQPISTAVDIMRSHRIRHLPVQDGGELVGVITDRDIAVASSFKGAGELAAQDVMMPDPYTVEPGTGLDNVVAEMAEHKYGCAIIRQKNGKVVGIFTAIDGLRYLAQIMREHYK
jgi:acetoin utilization protein AcuB